MPVPGGLTYKDLDLQSDNIFLDLFTGYAEPAEVRGSDDVVPGKEGRYRRNRVLDFRRVELRGHVRGTGATAVERQQSWRAATDALMAVLDPTDNTAGSLVVLAPYLGLEGGTAALSAYPVNMIGSEPQNTMSYQRWSIELQAIGDPPEWEFTAES